MTTEPRTVAEAINTVGALLFEAGIENARSEARLIVQHVMEISASQVWGFRDDKLHFDVWKNIWPLAERRTHHEPLAYIIKEKEFWSLTFKVSNDTLIPRPDSETLIEAILDFTPDKQARLKILDLGTGSGCLLGALLSELRHAAGVGVDANVAAVNIARNNMKRLGFSKRTEIRTGDWGYGITETFDIIACNPPYISSLDIEKLDLEIRHYEPHLALDGGEDGLEVYRILAGQMIWLLKDTGLAAVEVGLGQAQAVSKIFEGTGLEISHIRRDLGARERCLLATVQN